VSTSTGDEVPEFVPDECSYHVSLDGAALDADGARRLGQAPIEAADEIDELRTEARP
jgi:hypothetical protein